MKAGQLATWVRSGNAAGPITLAAQSSGLTQATLTLNADPTAIFRPTAPLCNPVAVKSPTAVAVFMGTKAFLPTGPGQKAMPLSLYDLSGREIQSARTRNQLNAMKGKLAGVYIVRTGK
jgi:hypothetical protein